MPGFRAAPSPRRFRGAGFTLLEVVVALAVMGLLATGGARLLRPHAALRAAEAARAFLLWARLEAIWTGHAVAVVPSPRAGLDARSGDAGDVASACEGPALKRLQLRRFGSVRVTEPLRAGIVWLPSGGARSCEGGGVISGSMLLADRGRRAAVVVSSLGRVRVEAEP